MIMFSRLPSMVAAVWFGAEVARTKPPTGEDHPTGRVRMREGVSLQKKQTLRVTWPC